MTSFPITQLVVVSVKCPIMGLCEMKNLMRASLYSVFSAKGIYITMSVLLFFAVLLGIFPDAFNMRGFSPYSGISTFHFVLLGIGNLIILVLVTAIHVSSKLFDDHRNVANLLAFGISKVKIYFSHLAVSMAISAVFMLIFMIIPVTLATVLRGLGDVELNFVLGKISVFLLNMLLLLALNSLATSLIFILKRTSRVIGAYFAIVLFPGLVFELFSFANPGISRLRSFNIESNLILLVRLPHLTSHYIIQSVSLGVGVIVLTTIIGIVLFELSDI